MAWPEELVIQLLLGQRSRRYIVPLQAGESTLEMVGDPNSLRSVIGERTWASLIMRGLAAPADEPRSCWLRELHIEGQAIPDLEARVSSVVGRIDGILGLDFFRNYRTVAFDTRALRIVMRN